MYTNGMGSGDMISVPSLINIDTGLQAIIRLFFRNLRGCNIGINDGRDS
jgi:hypothetical protein